MWVVMYHGGGCKGISCGVRQSLESDQTYRRGPPPTPSPTEQTPQEVAIMMVVVVVIVIVGMVRGYASTPNKGGKSIAGTCSMHG